MPVPRAKCSILRHIYDPDVARLARLAAGPAHVEPCVPERQDQGSRKSAFLAPTGLGGRDWYRVSCTITCEHEAF